MTIEHDECRSGADAADSSQEGPLKPAPYGLLCKGSQPAELAPCEG